MNDHIVQTVADELKELIDLTGCRLAGSAADDMEILKDVGKSLLKLPKNTPKTSSRNTVSSKTAFSNPTSTSKWSCSTKKTSNN